MTERIVTDSTGAAPDGHGANGKPDVEALRAEIRQTRAELGETVQALAAKADVKARAKEQVEYTKARALDRLHEVGDKARAQLSGVGDKARTELGSAELEVRRRPLPYAAILGAGIALVGIILIVRGRRR